MSCDGPASHHYKEIERVEKVPNVPIQRPHCSDWLEMPEVGQKRNNYTENDFMGTVTKIDGAMAHRERMQNSAFWIFLWNDVYENDETEAKIQRKKEAAEAALSKIARENVAKAASQLLVAVSTLLVQLCQRRHLLWPHRFWTTQ